MRTNTNLLLLNVAVGDLVFVIQLFHSYFLSQLQ